MDTPQRWIESAFAVNLTDEEALRARYNELPDEYKIEGLADDEYTTMFDAILYYAMSTVGRYQEYSDDFTTDYVKLSSY